VTNTGTERCARAGEAIEATWGPEREAAIARAFEATGRSHAADTAKLVADRVDAYAARWAATRRQVCEATHVQSTQSARLLDDRIACLDRRREEPSIRVDEVYPVHEAAEQLCTGVRIVLHDRDATGERRTFNGELKTLQTMLRQQAGQARVYLDIREQSETGPRRVVIDTRLGTRPAADLPQRIAAILQTDQPCVELEGPQRLDRQTMSDEGACASIDRY